MNTSKNSYYSDNIMMWLSVDPMSDERPNVSPYSYCQNNPIGRKDDWGMLDDEWEINRAGKITWLNNNTHYDANGNEVDKLFNSKGNSIDVSKGILKHGTSDSFVGHHFFQFGNDVTAAENFYYFCAQSSDVEWSFAEAKQAFGAKFGYTGTDFNSSFTQMPTTFEKKLGGNNILRMSHSHPLNSPYAHPSYNVHGKDAGDINNAKKPSAFNYIREVFDVYHNRIYEYSRNTSIPHYGEGKSNLEPKYDKIRYINIDYR